MAQNNSFRTRVAFALEDGEIGATPADATEWAAAEGTTAWQIYCVEASPDYILGDALVENADLQPEVFAVGEHHHGLPTADGGALKIRLLGSGETWTTDTAVAGSVQGTMLQHALGGSVLGRHTAIDTVTTQTSLVLLVGTGLEPGMIIGIADADDPTRIFPVQVLTVAGAAITIDRALPFTVAPGDKVYGAINSYPDAEALSNPDAAGYSTCALLYSKSTDVWVAGGGHLELQSIELPRGQQPLLNFGIFAARGYPPGAGAPTSPSWAGPIEGGNDTLAVGRDTKLFLQSAGTTTFVSECIFDAAFTVGVPIVPQDGVTEAHDGAPGRCSYATKPAATTLVVTVILDDAHQDYWADGTVLTATYYQVAPSGRGYAIHLRHCKMMGPPKPAFAESNRYTITLQAVEDIDNTADPLLAAKFVLAQF